MDHLIWLCTRMCVCVCVCLRAIERNGCKFWKCYVRLLVGSENTSHPSPNAAHIVSSSCRLSPSSTLVPHLLPQHPLSRHSLVPCPYSCHIHVTSIHSVSPFIPLTPFSISILYQNNYLFLFWSSNFPNSVIQPLLIHPANLSYAPLF